MVTKNQKAFPGRIILNALAKRDPNWDRLTIFPDEDGGVAITPYTQGDELLEDRQTVNGSCYRVLIPQDFGKQLDFRNGGLMEVQFDSDGQTLLLTSATDICVLCGMEMQKMVRMPSGRRICSHCWQIIRNM